MAQVGLLEGDARREAGDALVHDGGAALLRVEVGQLERPRHDDIVAVEGHGQHGRQDADDLAGDAVDLDHAADDGGVAAEAVFPEAAVDHGDRCAALGVLGRGELPAAHRREPEDGQEIRGGVEAEDLLGLAGALGQREAVAGGHADVGEDILPRAVGLELGPRQRGRLQAALVVDRPDADERLRVRVGQRPQHDGLQDAEQCGAGADGDGHREHGDGGEPGRLAQGTEGELQVENMGLGREAISFKPGVLVFFG